MCTQRQIFVSVCNMDDEMDMYEHGQGEEF